ncbi:rhomboid family intramembrane serine protease [Cutibacterium avidum]|uniref:rhomboid family intramembrane serine protease n=1 Tax=Cutibacterium avidum TaxID=33010 RepID=UPI003F496000
MSQNNQRPDNFSRPDEWGSWEDEPKHDEPSWAPPQPDSGHAERTSRPGSEPYRSAEVDPSWEAPSASYQQAAPRPVARVKRRSDVPAVTWTLIGICFLVWAGEWVSPQIRDAVVLAPIQGFHEPWRFVTSMFGHALSILHIGFNMYALWALGRSLEPFLGRARFLAAYLMSGLGGGVLFCLMASPHGDGRFLPNMNDGVVGASGAIFGLFGVLLIVQRRLGASTRDLWIVLAINAALLLFISGIAWQAHLGGFVVGLACGVIFFEDPKRIQAGKSPQTWPRMAMLLGVLVILVLLKYYVF